MEVSDKKPRATSVEKKKLDEAKPSELDKKIRNILKIILLEARKKNKKS